MIPITKMYLEGEPLVMKEIFELAKANLGKVTVIDLSPQLQERA